MGAAATQMNVRIPAEVKAAGDKALLSEGLTPTEVVRCVWEKAARRGRDLQQVVDLVRTPAKTRPSTNLFESAALVVSSQMLVLGVDLSIEDSAQPSDEELLEMAYYEKAAGRGLL